jgi:DNA-binding MarR family transcriptional regulator
MPADRETGNYQLPDVDRLIHEPARYGIMALLYVVERAEFLFVQNQIGLTPGNLSSHVTKLEAAGYVKIEKKFVKKSPRTFLRLSKQGRSAFEDYREKMKELFTTPPGRQSKNDTE